MFVQSLIGAQIRVTHIREEHPGNAASSMNPLLMPCLLIIAAHKTALVARNAVLVRFNATLIVTIDRSAEDISMFARSGCFLLPTEREVSRRDNLDEIHIIECLFIRVLLRPIQWVDMVISPTSRFTNRLALRHTLDDDVGELGTESQMMDLVREAVVCSVFEVVVQIVHVQIAVGETLSWCDVEVSDHFVHADSTFESAAFCALGIEVLGIVFALALLYAFAATEGP